MTVQATLQGSCRVLRAPMTCTGFGFS